MTGTGVIAGAVVTDESPAQPVRKAIVTVSGSALPNSRTTITDSAGKFAIGELPEGRFTITVKKAAYIPGAYGATRPGRPGTALALAAGQRADVTLTIARAAVVAGVIRDQQGDPVPGVQVGALKISGSGIAGNFGASDMTTTDDRGVYRIFGLLPGEYVVAAIPRVTGRGEIGSRSAAEMDAMLLALQRRSGRGGPAPPPGSPPVSQPPPPISVSYAPTYFPGSTVFARATRIRLASNDERTGVDFIVSPVESGIIEGSITGAGESAAAVQLTIQIDGPRASGQFSTQPVLSVKPGQTNQFRYTNVAPGRYRIMARLAPGSAPPPGGGVTISGGGSPGSSRPPNSPSSLYAVTDIETTGTDVTGVILSLQQGANVSGRTVFDSSTVKAPEDLTGIRVTISPPGGTYMSSAGGTVIGNTFQSVSPAQLRPDGTFTATGIAPGTYQLRVAVPANLSQIWTLESVVSRGKDLLDLSLEIEAGADLSDVAVTFSDRRSELSGTLQTSAGSPAPEYFVVAFSTDRTYWIEQSRRLKSVRPGTDGRFTFTGLPAGDYLVAALTDVDPDEWQSPSFLEQLVPAAIRVAIASGARVTQDIRVVR